MIMNQDWDCLRQNWCHLQFAEGIPRKVLVLFFYYFEQILKNFFYERGFYFLDAELSRNFSLYIGWNPNKISYIKIRL